ncbi:MAG: hypothetical protein OEV42_09540 [Deltaproteobacteria bacterium]|nr:hypothetical protein [Deltaproteobacteria bacterium]
MLAKEPNEFELHLKMAPILVSMKNYKDAASSFKKSAEGYYKKGKVDMAIAVYRQAARAMPNHSGLWERLARLELDRNKTSNALAILMEGSKHFHKKSTRDKSVRLLRIAFKIKPWHFDTTLELVRQLAKKKEKREAVKILKGLSKRAETNKMYRKAMRTQFRISPTPGHLLLLMRSFFRRG